MAVGLGNRSAADRRSRTTCPAGNPHAESAYTDTNLSLIPETLARGACQWLAARGRGRPERTAEIRTGVGAGTGGVKGRVGSIVGYKRGRGRCMALCGTFAAVDSQRKGPGQRTVGREWQWWRFCHVKGTHWPGLRGRGLRGGEALPSSSRTPVRFKLLAGQIRESRKGSEKNPENVQNKIRTSFEKGPSNISCYRFYISSLYVLYRLL